MKANAPDRTDMREVGDTGAPLVVKGTVFSEDCITPLEGAIVEVWQADGTGAYDSEQFRYRASMGTDAEGHYSYTTNVPGKYRTGSSYRPSHIHFRVSANDHVTLVSQVYFDGDSDIAADPWASDPDAEARILTVTDLESGEKEVTFDIFMVLPT